MKNVKGVKMNMKAIIRINFENINGTPVDKRLLKTIPLLYNSTLKTSEILCENIEKYFNDHKIKVRTKLELLK